MTSSVTLHTTAISSIAVLVYHIGGEWRRRVEATLFAVRTGDYAAYAHFQVVPLISILSKLTSAVG